MTIDHVIMKIVIVQNGWVSQELHWWFVKNHLRDHGCNARFVISLPYVLQFVTQRLCTFILNTLKCHAHVVIYNHLVSIGVCCESLEMDFQCVANGVDRPRLQKKLCDCYGC